MADVLSFGLAKDNKDGFARAEGARVLPAHRAVIIEIDHPASLRLKLTTDEARAWARALLRVARLVDSAAPRDVLAGGRR